MEFIIRLSEKLNRHTRPRHFYFVLFLFLSFSILFQNGGMIHSEIQAKLPIYLSDQPILQTIFDSNSMEIKGSFRPRQLSYFFDCLDAKFIEWSVIHGFPHFLSLTHYLGCLLIALMMWRFLTNHLRIGRLAGLCIVSLFLFSPGPFLAASFFRSAKIGATVMMFITFLQIWPHLVASGESSTKGSRFWQRVTLIFSLAACAALFDEQGFFFVALASLFCWLHYHHCRNRVFFHFSLALLAASLFLLVYNAFLAPFIVYHLHGYHPSFYYQLSLEWDWVFSLFFLKQAVFFLIDNFRSFFGNLTQIQAICTLLLLGLLIDLKVKKASPLKSLSPTNKKRTRLSLSEPRFYFPLLMLALIVLNLIMVSRHPLIAIAGGYYWLPSLIVIVIITSFALKIFFDIGPKSRAIGRIILIVLLLGNLAGLLGQQSGGAALSKDQRIYTVRMMYALWNIRDASYQPHPALNNDPILAHFKKKIAAHNNGR